MSEYAPTFNTQLFVGLFAALYLYWLVRKTIKSNLDIYDSLLLSTVAILPAFLVFVPRAAEWVGVIFGVKTAAVVMLGALLFVVFLLLHRLVLNVFTLEQRCRDLVQELAIIKENNQHDEGQ